MFSVFMSSRRRSLLPVFLWASVCSFMYGRFCFHHVGLVLTKEKGKTTVVPRHSFMPYVGWQFAYAGPFPKICVGINKN